MSRSPISRACRCTGLSIIAAATATLVLSASMAAAQTPVDEFAAGKAEYLSACGACHGDAADGKGPIASMFRAPVPDLTGLAQRNEGTFPFLKVFQIIDGRAKVRAHGDPMPIFGSRFRAEAEAEGTAYGTEAITRARLLELVLYLQSIQD